MESPRVESKPGLTVARLQRLARSLQAAVKSDLATDFLNATSALPWIQPRKLYQDPESKVLYPSSQIASISAERRWKLVSRSFDEHDCYEGRYGMPLSYAAFLDALSDFGVRSLSGKRVLDLGFASILPLRLMACLGASVTGLETDKLVAALYAFDGDTGPVRSVRGRTIDRSHDGSIAIKQGRLGVDWKPEAGSLDLILSRNTLKQGYVHPRAEHAHEPNVKLKLTDEAFLETVRASLSRGGLFAIYNTFDPTDNGPGANGHCPFSREQLAASRFEVLAHDQSDDSRALALFAAADAAGSDLAGPLGKLAPRALLTIARAV
ncbi:MAG: hypothetical protein JNM86_09250 [Phycisphaerae bacterium]|nr:hypothetical protein [Phycisphaerae bacterium]